MTQAGQAPVAVVTGASSGIGLAAAFELCRRGFRLALLGRDPGRLAAARQQVSEVASVPVRAYECDFASLAQVRRVAAEIRSDHDHIDVLANNAGGNVGARRLTEDGFEETIQGNHLAHFLLSHELRERLRGGRIVNTSSRVHAQGRLDPGDLNGDRRGFVSLAFYANAKQANVLFTVEAAKRWPDIVSAAFHPGVVRSRFGRESRVYSVFYRFAPGLRSPAQGARTLVHLATADPQTLVSGGYYVDDRLQAAAPRASDAALAERLWSVSAKAVGV